MIRKSDKGAVTQVKDFPYMIRSDSVECRTKCPALIHECRTYKVFYWKMSDNADRPLLKQADQFKTVTATAAESSVIL